MGIVQWVEGVGGCCVEDSKDSTILISVSTDGHLFFRDPCTITRVSSRVAGEPSDARADSAQCAVRDMNPADHHSHSILGRGRVCVCVCVDTCQNAHMADLTGAEHVSACVSYDQAMARSYQRSPPLPLPPPSMR